MKITAYLAIDENCEEALGFYAEIFGGTVANIMRYKDMPGDDQMPGAGPDDIMHAEINFGDQSLYVSQMGAGTAEGKSPPVSLHTSWPDYAKAEAVFNALSAGGNVMMPFGKTFWSEGFGVLTDKYGIQWMTDIAEQS